MSIENKANYPKTTDFKDGRLFTEFQDGRGVMRFPNGKELEVPTITEIQEGLMKAERFISQRLRELNTKLPRWDREADKVRITI